MHARPKAHDSQITRSQLFAQRMRMMSAYGEHLCQYHRATHPVGFCGLSDPVVSSISFLGQHNLFAREATHIRALLSSVKNLRSQISVLFPFANYRRPLVMQLRHTEQASPSFRSVSIRNTMEALMLQRVPIKVSITQQVCELCFS